MQTDDDKQNLTETNESVQTEQVNAEDVHADGDAPAVAKRKRSKWEITVNVALWAAIVVLAMLVALKLFVFNYVEVDGTSMSPTYTDGEKVKVNKVKNPKRGDVVVFYVNDVDNKFKAMFADEELCKEGQPYEKYIKRIVALAGDKIWIRQVSDGEHGEIRFEVVVDTPDGKRLTEDYYVKKGETLPQDRYYIYQNGLSDAGRLQNCTESNPFVVSEGCFFAMGDHRLNSKDSRELGEFPLTRLFGVVYG